MTDRLGLVDVSDLLKARRTSLVSTSEPMSNVNEHASRLLLRATPRVLSIAGTDPTGGAGIQADLKSIAANGGYGMAVVTALVAQNTHGVLAVHTPSVEFLRQQLDAVSHDVQIDAVKIGMLAELAVIDEVRSWLQTTRPPLVVLDPVMVSTSGDRLLAASAEQALRNLVSLVDLVTPNLPELAVLLQEEPAAIWAEALEQGKRLSTATGVTVLVKGGHLTGADCPDALVNSHGLLAETVVEFVSPRVVTNNTHGTGCSLSSAMATVQAQTGDWAASLSRVKEWLNDALAHAHSLEVGSGNGPIHHFHQLFADRAPRGREFSESLWAGITSIRSRIFELPFIVALGNGTLDGVDFAYYLAQDAVCLNTYSHVLTRASRLAPTEEEQRFWANSAQLCLEVEAELHRSWVGDHPQPAPGLVTKGYLDHLLAVGVQGSYAVVVAALLPRFWLNAELGERLQAEILAQGRAEAHPYAAWLETYSNQAFVESARRAVAFVDAAAAAASSGERQNMKAVFEQSSQFELDFFDSPRLHARL